MAAFDAPEKLLHRAAAFFPRRGSVGLGLLLALGGCGGGAAPEGGFDAVGIDSQGILGGEQDLEHRNVFGTVTHEGNAGASCTATLIAPNLLLTARHCVSRNTTQQVICGQSELGESYPGTAIYATNAVTFREAREWFQGLEVAVPPGADDTCGHDVALIILGSNVPSSVAEPAVPRIDRDVVTGESYAAVGYGVADDGDAGERRSAATWPSVVDRASVATACASASSSARRAFAKATPAGQPSTRAAKSSASFREVPTVVSTPCTAPWPPGKTGSSGPLCTLRSSARIRRRSG